MKDAAGVLEILSRMSLSAELTAALGKSPRIALPQSRQDIVNHALGGENSKRLAPSLRHTHGQGRQSVVHNPVGELREVFSLNLYPGPSVQKGISGALLNIGESGGIISEGVGSYWAFAAERMVDQANLLSEQIRRCTMRIEGVVIPRGFLQVDTQTEVGPAAYDQGERILSKFFEGHLRPYLDFNDLDPLGREIVECATQQPDLARLDALLHVF